jgi:hypothetical protein
MSAAACGFYDERIGNRPGGCIGVSERTLKNDDTKVIAAL